MGHALFEFLRAEIWCALLFVACVGWGLLAVKPLAGPVASTGLAASVGVALAVLAGGVLNLLHLITPEVLIGLTLFGVALAVGQVILRTGTNSLAEVAAVFSAWRALANGPRLALLCFACLFLFRLASTPRVSDYTNKVDDENFYLPMPAKMMEVHDLAPDPYSERRITSSLGGGYFLQGMVLSVLPLYNVQMADRCLGVFVMVFVCLALATRCELSTLETAIFLIFSISIPPFDTNLTFGTLPSGLWLAMALIALHRNFFAEKVAFQGFLIGLLAGTLCCLKSTYLPHVAMLCLALFFLWGWRNGWWFTLRGWSFAFLGALVLLVPWMIANRMTCGTYLFPVLGHGYDYSAYHQFPTTFTTSPMRLMEQGSKSFLPLGLLVAVQIFLLGSDEIAMVFLAVSVACLAGTVATAIATGGDSLQRYGFPIVMPTVLLSFVQLCRELRRRPGWKIGQGLLAFVGVVLVGWTLLRAGRGQSSVMLDGIKKSVTGQSWEAPEIVQEYADISAAMPKDGQVLATLRHAYLLDHLDEHILLADWPGCASLPPGWPIKKDGEALAEYLLSQSIRYLAYTYGSYTPWDRLDWLGGKPKAPPKDDFSVWMKTQLTCYTLADQQYLELRQTRRVLYDDGNVFIVDLATKVAPPVAATKNTGNSN